MARTARIRLASRLALGLVIATAGPAPAQVPEPADIIGFAPGEDFKLATYGPIAEYFEALAASTDRMVLEEIGESTRGKPLYLAAISSPANLARLIRIREITRTLAYARDPSVGPGSILDETRARELAREGVAVVWIDGGLHATEVAHGQVMPEMAHHFVTDESEETRRIRENTVLLLMPNMNPDGLDIVAEWYMSNVGGEYEMAPVPELYHHYIGHDNNRDWYMVTQAETKAVTHQLYHEWFPQIVYNQHQSSPFPGRIWMPPFENPVSPHLDPLLVSSLNQMGHSMRKRFDVEGKPGVNSGIVFDLWWNGSMRGGPDYHNMLGFLTETAGAGYATPRCYEPDELPETFGERADMLPAHIPSTSYNNPWRGGCWHIRDAMDYMMTAAKAVADMGAKLKDEYLFNHYWMGRRQIERGRRAEGGAFAYVIDPRRSHDRGSVYEFIDLMRRSGIEFLRASEPFTVEETAFEPGTFIIPPQAFRPYVVDLMEPKRYPDRRQYPGGPPEPPYDMTGYELRFQMGLDVAAIDTPFDLPAGNWGDVSPVAAAPRGSGTAGFAVHGNSNTVYRALAPRLASDGVQRTTRAIPSLHGEIPAGSFWIAGLGADEAGRLASGEQLTLTGMDAAPPADALVPVRMPRIAIYRSYRAAMPEGWTRWTLDTYGIPWENVWNEDVRSGDLSRFDAIVLPSQSRAAIEEGYPSSRVPIRFAGGLGAEGAAALRAFVEAGGRVVAFDESVDYAIETFALPFRNRVAGLPSEEFFIPGSLIRLEVDPSHPLSWGMPDSAVALFARSQVLERTGAGAAVSTPVCYAGDAPLLSGWTLGAEEHLAGRTAAARIEVGRGDVVLFAFTPHFRGQPRNTFKLLFNALTGSASRTPEAEGLPCR
ncbi:MAG: M14 family metallopeptidase [Gemmatimonadota bacterium]|nr:M14 family metallopeptidase [Gemmatimonadota bacterium]